MADTSFFGATGTTASTQNTIQTSVDAAAASATAASTAQTATEAARDLALGYKNAAATSETNAAASAVTANQNAANTTAVANIASDVTSVAGIASAVSTTAGISSAISSVSADATDIGAVAAKATQSGLRGTSDAVADMNTLGTSSIVSNMATLSGISSAISTTAGIASAVSTTAGISSAVSSVAADATDIGVVAGKETEIGLLGTSANVTAMGLLGTSANVTAMSNVSGSISNVNTVASNLTSINDFADKYRIGSSDPSSNNDEGDLFYNTGSNTLKVYNGSAWEQGVTAGSGFLALSGGALTGDLSLNTNLVFEGSTADANETTVTATDPTADRTVTIPDKTGTLVTVASDGTTGQLLRTDGSGNYSFVTVQTNLSGDSNPTLSGNLDVGTHDIVSSSNNDISFLPNGTGKVVADGNGSSGGISLTDGLIEMRTGGGSVAQIDMYCEVSNAHKVSIKAPAHSNYSGNVNFTLPAGNGSNGQFLQTDGSGNLSYATVAQPSDATTSAAGLMSASDKTKMDAIEASATADQTASEIRALVESASDSNVFTDADHTKLNGIETSATADQTAAEILTAVKTVDGASSGLDADLLDGQEGSYYLDANNFSNMPSSELSGDSSPQLAGTLDTNGQAIQFGASKWTILLDGTDLEFRYNNTAVFKLASNGAVTSANDITAFGSP